MNNHDKKVIAPIVVTVLVIIYYIFYFAVIICAIKNIVAKVLLGIIPVLLALTMIYVCTERIKEIRSGEEDDLSKY